MYNDIKDLFHSKGYKFFENEWSLNIFGIRVMEAANLNSELNERIGVAYTDGDGQKVAMFFPACTVPAVKYLKSPINTAGCAVLKSGQYRGSHQLGKHKGRNALIQTGAKVTVWRDRNLDEVVDFGGKEQDGYFGINIHDGKSRDWSAGCQIMHKEDLDIILALARKSAAKYGNSFTYTLF